MIKGEKQNIILILLTAIAYQIITSLFISKPYKVFIFTQQFDILLLVFPEDSGPKL